MPAFLATCAAKEAGGYPEQALGRNAFAVPSSVVAGFRTKPKPFGMTVESHGSGVANSIHLYLAHGGVNSRYHDTFRFGTANRTTLYKAQALGAKVRPTARPRLA